MEKMTEQLSRKQLWDYWKNPDDGKNQFAAFDAQTARSQFIADLFQKLQVSKNALILEVGSGTGRNLRFLYHHGYSHVFGIEISKQAINYNPLPTDIPVLNKPVEQVISNLDDEMFDVVFTCATLQHLHVDSEWVFREIARVAKIVVTVEDEVHQSPRHFPRDYRHIFEELGFKQVLHVCPCEGFKNEQVTCRVFRK